MALLRDLKVVIQELEQGLGLPVDVLAGALLVDSRPLERWRAGQAYPQREARSRLDRLVALLQHLQQTFTTQEAVRSWMHTDNRYLALLKPAEVARAGRIDRIEAALEALDSGIFV